MRDDKIWVSHICFAFFFIRNYCPNTHLLLFSHASFWEQTLDHRWLVSVFCPNAFSQWWLSDSAITMVWLIPLVTDFHCFPQKWEEEDNLRLSPLPIPWEPFLWKSWQHCRVVKILYGLNQTLAKITQPVSYCNRNAAVRCDARPWAVLSVVAGHLSNCFIISFLVNSFGLRFSECTL